MPDETTNETSDFEFVSRYGTGPGPDPATMCDGQCEGMGVYPQRADAPDMTAHERAEVERIRAADGQSEDGYYFVRCAECGGTGTRRA